MENNNNHRLPKRAKTQPARPELTVVATTSSRHPSNDERGHHQPHDKFIKCAFKIKEIAIDFFTAHLADKGLNKHQLEKFNLSNSEHQQPFRPKLLSDLVYRGEIENQVYYIALEHQSSFDRKIISRLLEYSAALINEYTTQNLHGHPIVLTVCLYHEPYHNSDLGNVHRDYRKSMLERLFGSKINAESFHKIYPIKVVDLTVMTDEEISKHGKAAIFEWILRDASLPGNEFLQQITQHLRHPCYRALASISDDFKLAMYEYILSVYKGDKSPNDLINIMGKVLPEEEEIMLTAAQQLEERGLQRGIQQGIQQGMHDSSMQIGENLIKLGVPLDIVQQGTHLSDEEMAQLSPSSVKSTATSRIMEATQGANHLGQQLSSIPEQTTSGSIKTTTVNSNEINPIFSGHKESRGL